VYKIFFCFLPIVKYSIDPIGFVKMTSNIHINFSFPLNSFFAISINATIGRTIQNISKKEIINLKENNAIVTILFVFFSC